MSIMWITLSKVNSIQQKERKKEETNQINQKIENKGRITHEIFSFSLILLRIREKVEQNYGKSYEKEKIISSL
jgi:hypothetical protein